MKKVFKKKFVSAALAAIMSVSALTGTIMSASAFRDKTTKDYYKYEYYKPDLIKNNYNFVYAKHNNTYNCLAIPSYSIAKVSYEKKSKAYTISTPDFGYWYIYNTSYNVKPSNVNMEGYTKKIYLTSDYSWEYSGSRLYYSGDIDKSGKIDIEDAVLAIQIVNGQRYNKYEYFLADMDNDGRVDLGGRRTIKNKVNGTH